MDLGSRRRSARCMQLEAVKVNSSESGLLSCGKVNGADIVSEHLHHGAGAGSRAMEFGRSGSGEDWRNRAYPHRQAGKKDREFERCGSRLNGAGPCEDVFG